MFVDASAIVGVMAREPEEDALIGKLQGASRRLTSPLAVYEAVLALARLRDAPVGRVTQAVERFLADAGVDIVTIGVAEHAAALDAFDRFGKGRHPARLNMGDCFAYACAKTHRVPLLCKGEDFRQTDAWIA